MVGVGTTPNVHRHLGLILLRLWDHRGTGSVVYDLGAREVTPDSWSRSIPTAEVPDGLGEPGSLRQCINSYRAVFWTL